MLTVLAARSDLLLLDYKGYITVKELKHTTRYSAHLDPRTDCDDVSPRAALDRADLCKCIIVHLHIHAYILFCDHNGNRESVKIFAAVRGLDRSSFSSKYGQVTITQDLLTEDLISDGAVPIEGLIHISLETVIEREAYMQQFALYGRSRRTLERRIPFPA